MKFNYALTEHHWITKETQPPAEPAGPGIGNKHNLRKELQSYKVWLHAMAKETKNI